MSTERVKSGREEKQEQEPTAQMVQMLGYDIADVSFSHLYGTETMQKKHNRHEAIKACPNFIAL